MAYRWTQDSFVEDVKRLPEFEALSPDDAFERATAKYPQYLAEIDPASMRPLPGVAYPFSKASFVEAVRAKDPAMAGKPDDDVFAAVTRQYPQYLRFINPVSFRPVERPGALDGVMAVAREFPGATKETVAQGWNALKSLLATTPAPQAPVGPNTTGVDFVEVPTPPASGSAPAARRPGVVGPNTTGVDFVEVPDQPASGSAPTARRPGVVEPAPQEPGVDFGDVTPLSQAKPAGGALPPPVGELVARNMADKMGTGALAVTSAMVGAGRNILGTAQDMFWDKVKWLPEDLKIRAFEKPTEFERIADDDIARQVAGDMAAGGVPLKVSSQIGWAMLKTLGNLGPFAAFSRGATAGKTVDTVWQAVKQSLPEASKFAAYVYGSTEGSEAEKALSAAHAVAFMTVPMAFSGISKPALRAVLTTMANMGVNTPGYVDAWKKAGEAAKANGTDRIDEMIGLATPAVVMDGLFGLSAINSPLARFAAKQMREGYAAQAFQRRMEDVRQGKYSETDALRMADQEAEAWAKAEAIRADRRQEFEQAQTKRAKVVERAKAGDQAAKDELRRMTVGEQPQEPQNQQEAITEPRRAPGLVPSDFKATPAAGQAGYPDGNLTAAERPESPISAIQAGILSKAVGQGVEPDNVRQPEQQTAKPQPTAEPQAGVEGEAPVVSGTEASQNAGTPEAPSGTGIELPEVSQTAEELASAKVGFPVARGTKVLLRFSRNGKVLKNPKAVTISQVLDENTARISIQESAGIRYEDVNIGRLAEPGNRTALRRYGESLAALTKDERKQVTAANKALSTMLEGSLYFFPPEAHSEIMGQASARDEAVARSGWMKLARARAAAEIGEPDADMTDPVVRAKLYPRIKEWMEGPGLEKMRRVQGEDDVARVKAQRSQVVVNESELQDGDLVWKDGEWYRVNQATADVTKLQDGTTIKLEAFDNVELAGVIAKGDPGYDQAIAEYQQQRREEKAVAASTPEVEVGVEKSSGPVAPDTGAEEASPRLAETKREGPNVISALAGWSVGVDPSFRRTPGWKAEVDYKNKRIVFETEADSKNASIMAHEVGHVLLERSLSDADRETFFAEYAREMSLPADLEAERDYIITNGRHHERAAMDLGNYLNGERNFPDPVLNLFSRLERQGDKYVLIPTKAEGLAKTEGRNGTETEVLPPDNPEHSTKAYADLKTIAEADIPASGTEQALASRSAQGVARRLLEQVDAGTISAADAYQKWQKDTDSQLRKFIATRTEAKAKIQGTGGGDQGDMFQEPEKDLFRQEKADVEGVDKTSEKRDNYVYNDREVETYFEAHDVSEEYRAETRKLLRAVSDASGEPYLPGLGPETSGDAGAGKPGTSVPRPTEDAQVAVLTSPTVLKGGALTENLRAAFAQGNTISSIVHGIVDGSMPGPFAFKGMSIQSPKDAATLMMFFRSRFKELLKVLYLDKDMQVLECRVASIGVLDSTLIGAGEIFGRLPEGAVYATLGHNHPSGDPMPSAEDMRITKQLVEIGDTVGVKVVDHIITDGKTFHSMASSDAVTFPAAPQVAEARGERVPDMPDQLPYERVSNAKLATRIREPIDLFKYATILREADPNFDHIIYLTSKNMVTAIERRPAGEVFELARTLRAIYNHGAGAILIETAQDADNIMQPVSELGKRVRLLDVAARRNGEFVSMREEGNLPEVRNSEPFHEPKTEYGAGSVRESTADYSVGAVGGSGEGAPGRPVGLKGLTDKSAADVNEAGQVVMQLPELVRLHKLVLGGKAPRVRQNIRARTGGGVVYGRFSANKLEAGVDLRASIADPVSEKRKIELEREANRLAKVRGDDADEVYKDLLRAEYAKPENDQSIQALKTLAHEIGHLDDWMDDKDLIRGNILGHIAAFKMWLQKMLPDDPSGMDRLPSVEERAQWRGEAERQARAEVLHGIPEKDRTEELKQRFRDRTAELYAERKKDEAAARKLVTRDEIMTELMDLSRWWRDDWTDASPGHQAYRESATELFADAVSVMLNNPLALAERAPKFQKALLNWASERPEFYAVYDQLQNEIKTGAVVDKTREAVRKGFEEAEEVKREALDQRESNWNQLKTALRFAFIDTSDLALRDVRNWIDPVSGKRGEKYLDAAKNPRFAIEDALYSGASMEAYIIDLNETILKPLKAAGLDGADGGEFMVYNRVINERYDKFNPEGIDPARAKLAQERMRETLGDDAMTLLMKLPRLLHKLRQRHFIDMAEEAGDFAPETMEKIKDNVNYARFDVIDHLNGRHGAGSGLKIFRSIGTLKSIANPFVATIRQDLSFIAAHYRNQAKKELIAFQRELGEAVPAATRWNGRYRETLPPKDPDQALLGYLENGKFVGWYVDKWTAAHFEFADPEYLRILSRNMQMVAGIARMLFTDARPGFWLTNTVRDMAAAIQHLPGAGYAGTKGFVKHWAAALKPAFRSAFGIPDPVVREMLEGNMLISMVNRGQGSSHEDYELDRMLVAVKLHPHFENKITKPLQKLGDILEMWMAIGKGFERANQVGVHTWLKQNYPDMDPRLHAHLVRTMASPAFLRRGALYPITNSIFMFSNAAKEGIRAEFEAYQRGAKDKNQRWNGEWWWKMTKYVIFPKLLQWLFYSGELAVVGLGAINAIKLLHVKDDGTLEPAKGSDAMTLAEAYRTIGQYDLANYHNVPFGYTPQGKVVYLRFPLMEQGRVLGGLTWKALTAAKNAVQGKPVETRLADMFDYLGGQMPNVHPMIGEVNAWASFLQNRDPYDPFRGRERIDKTVFAARDSQAWVDMLKQTSNNLGVGMFIKFDTDDPVEIRNKLEKILKLPVGSDIIGRFLKVSDQGVRDVIRESNREVDKIEARERLQNEKAFKKDGEVPAEIVLKGAGYIKNRVREEIVSQENTWDRSILNARSDEERERMMELQKEFKRTNPKQKK